MRDASGLLHMTEFNLFTALFFIFLIFQKLIGTAKKMSLYFTSNIPKPELILGKHFEISLAKKKKV